jgi:hypothetical protein
MRKSYGINHMIGDYEQRSKAMDMFFESHSHIVPWPRPLAARARRKLAEEILWSAAHAFEESAPDVVPRLTRLARSIYPRIILTPLWGKLSLRRLVGPRCWRGMMPWAELIRAPLRAGPLSRTGQREDQSGLHLPRSVIGNGDSGITPCRTQQLPTGTAD